MNIKFSQMPVLGAMIGLVFALMSLSSTVLADGDHSQHGAMHNTMTPIASKLTVYKSATCSCCKKWVSHLQDNGLNVTSQNHNQMSVIKDKYKIDNQYRSCHTGVSQDGFVFEGHIPAKFIKQFLKEKPVNAIGLAVPAMPVGSPGMEHKNKFMPYKVLQLNNDGSSQVYAEINNAFQQ